MSPTPAALRLHDVHKRLGGRPILRGVSLEIPAGRTVALLGPNGAGKSTLLRIAAATSRPDQGSVEVDGVDARKDPDAARRHASLLLQQAPLYAELTPHEHLAWWAKVRGVQADVEAATLECGLARHAHRPAATLSRGQQQRLALAMALLPDAPLLVLDEPFTALDDEARAWLDARLAARAGATLMALHEAPRRADATVRLDGGLLA
ncbi:MAG TPA: heme ABC exporter ATP-binding protein CcmA [Candidatus Thermoplasmatota archaeon]|nr:heme ABC exporter ATP-binding protein CcmA [Candidatus Thermoplasmatota archaeon]